MKIQMHVKFCFLKHCYAKLFWFGAKILSLAHLLSHLAKSKAPPICISGESVCCCCCSESPPPADPPSSSGGNRFRYCPAWSCGIVHLQANLHLRTHWPSTPRPTTAIGQDAGAVSTLGREKVGGGARWLSGRPANHVRRRQRLQSGFAQPCSKVSAVSESLSFMRIHHNNNNNNNTSDFGR